MAVNLPYGLGSMPVTAIGTGPGRDSGAPIYRCSGPIAALDASNVLDLCNRTITYSFLAFVNLAGSRNSWCDVQANGSLLFNWSKYEARVRRFTVAGGASQAAADAVTAAFAARRFIAYTVDEPYIEAFNGSIPFSVQNDMGLLFKEIWPGCLTSMRSAFEFMQPAPAGGWTGIDYGWAQYNRVAVTSGKTAREWFDYQRAGFLALNCGMVPALNWLNCGDTRNWDYLNNGSSSGTVAGDGGNGRLLCSPDQLREIADAIYDDADAPGMSGYTYTSSNLGNNFQTYEVRSDYVAAFDYILNKFATRPAFNGFRTAKGAPGNPGGGGTGGITHVGTSFAAGAAVAPVAHNTGDLMIADVGRADTGVTISVPAGWTAINGGNSPNATIRQMWRYAPDTSTAAITFTNASYAGLSIYRGIDPTNPIGGNGQKTGSGTDVLIPGLTLVRGDGTSWVHTGVVHATATNVNSAPTGMTNRGSNGQLANFDTGAGITAWGQVTKTLNASGGWRALSVEIKADPNASGGTVNHAPTLDLISSPKLVTELGTLTFEASGADQDQDTLAFSLQPGTSAVPAGATIDSSIGVFSWTPPAGSAGTYNIKVRVTDTTGINPSGLFAEQAFNIIVSPPPEVPVLNTTAILVAQRAHVDLDSAQALIDAINAAEQMNAQVIRRTQILKDDLQTSVNYMQDVLDDLNGVGE